MTACTRTERQGVIALELQLVLLFAMLVTVMMRTYLHHQSLQTTTSYEPHVVMCHCAQEVTVYITNLAMLQLTRLLTIATCPQLTVVRSMCITVQQYDTD